MPLKPQRTPLPPVRTRTRPAAKSVPAADQARQLLATNARKRSKPSPPEPGADDVPTPAAASYKVGYGKPPRDHQFKRGQSGNPNGRPKTAQSLLTLVRKRMLEKVQVKTASGIKSVTRIDALLMKAMEQGGKGEFRAIKELFSLYATAVPEPRKEEGMPSPVDHVDLSAADQAILALFRAEVASELLSAPKPSVNGKAPETESDRD